MQNRSYWKFVGKFLLIILAAIGALWGGFFIQQWQATKNVEKFAEGLETWQKEQYDLAMRDTYGGKTPQETLQMYINAVEKGDYELASKYFILDKQEKELNSFKNSQTENIKNVLALLKQTINSSGSFSEDKKGFIIRKPLLVDFLQYPNGIWKIIEI